MTIQQFIPLYMMHATMHHQMIEASHHWATNLGLTSPVIDAFRTQYQQHNTKEQWQHFYLGLERVKSATHITRPDLPEIVWQRGASTLHRYAERGAPVLLVPSLINRSYIFDLSKQRSLARYLADQGFATHLLNWNEPGDEEQHFDVAAYVNQRVVAAVEQLRETYQQPVTLVGYCMGGMMSLAAAQLLGTEKVDKLALLATPWDFRQRVHQLPYDNNAYIQWLGQLCRAQPTISGDLIHTLLYLANPWTLYDKFCRIATTPDDSEQFTSLLEREYWLHDTCPLSSKVVLDAMIHWPNHNPTYRGKWSVAGQAIHPPKVQQPTLIAHAQYDAIIPKKSIEPLVEEIENATFYEAPNGHIGMVAGMRAKKQLWLTLAKWLRSV